MFFPGFASFTPEQPCFGESFTCRLQEKAEQGSLPQPANLPCLREEHIWERFQEQPLPAQGLGSQLLKEWIETEPFSQRKRRWVWTAEAHSLGNSSGALKPFGISSGIWEAAEATGSLAARVVSRGLNAQPCNASGPSCPKPTLTSIR